MLLDPNNPFAAKGRPLGIEFKYHEGSKVFDSRPAHRLLYHARAAYGSDMQNKLQEIFFRRHHQEGQNLNDVLLDACKGACPRSPLPRTSSPHKTTRKSLPRFNNRTVPIQRGYHTLSSPRVTQSVAVKQWRCLLACFRRKLLNLQRSDKHKATKERHNYPFAYRESRKQHKMLKLPPLIEQVNHTSTHTKKESSYT